MVLLVLQAETMIM